jgi:glycerophosphoryl diester phosphodiesterase
MGKIKKFLQYLTLAGAITGAALVPFRGDFSPRNEYGKQIYDSKMVVAHRGGDEGYRANTLEAFRNAKGKSDMIELDVRKTKDGKLVVYHDRTISMRPIGWLNYNDAEKIANKQGYHLPTLDEALREIGNKRVIIDMKEKGFEKDVVDFVKKYAKGQAVVSSQDVESLKEIKNVDSNVKTSVVMPGGFPFWGTAIREKFGVVPWRHIKEARADFVSVDGKGLNPKFYENASKGDVGVFVYGLNPGREMKNVLTNKAVKGVIMDKLSETNSSGGLERTVNGFAILLTLGFVVFLSPNITGNAIADLPIKNSNFVAISLFVLLILFLSFVRKR